MLRKRLRSDNRGLTLMELVCSVAILAIITSTVGGAMIVASNSYQRGTREAALQQEAQFTANAIESLVIDATDTITWDGTDLIVKNSDYTYKLHWDSADGEITFSQYMEDAYGHITYLEGMQDQLLAQHVTSLVVDSTRFATSRNLGVIVKLENQGVSFETVYNITSRNRVDFDDTALTASIAVANDVTLEPNQSYPLRVSVIASAGLDKGYDYAWLEDEGRTPVIDVDDTTLPGYLILTPDGGETGGSDGDVRLQLSSRAKKDGNPLTTKQVTVHIRRVNDIDIPAAPVNTSGTNFEAGAEYRVDAKCIGTHFAKVSGTCDNDYVDPRHITWTFSSNWDEYVDNASMVVVEDVEEPYIQFKLKKDLDAGQAITATATAKHPAGENKTGISYATVQKNCTLRKAGGGPISFPYGLSRGTDNWFIDVMTYGAGKTPKRYFRYREVIYDDEDNFVGYGEWTEWDSEKLDGGTPMMGADGRTYEQAPESVTHNLEYNKCYQMQFDSCYTIGTTQYPVDEATRRACTDLYNEYRTTVDFNKLQITYNSYGDDNWGPKWNGYWNEWVEETTPLYGVLGIGTEDDPMVLDLNRQYTFYYEKGTIDVTGVKYVKSGSVIGVLQSKMKLECYPYDEDAEDWSTVEAASDMANFYRSLEQEAFKVKVGKPGTYKLVMNYSDGTPYANEKTGVGVFYFKVN